MADATDYDADYAPEPLPQPQDVLYWLQKAENEPRSQRETVARECFREQFRLDRLVYDDLSPLAAVVAYRVTRAWLYLTDQLALEEPLGAKDIDWTSSLTVQHTHHLTPQDKVTFAESLVRLREHSSPLSPVAATNGTLAAWSRTAATIARELRAERPCGAFPFASSKVVRLLTRPDAAQRVWPTPANLMEFEETLASATFEIIRDQGKIAARNDAVGRYGFSRPEANAQVNIALEIEHSLFRSTPEQEKALSIARAEAAMDRSRRALDRRGESMANKLVSVVVGLGRAEVEDVHSEFHKLAGKVLPLPAIPRRPALDVAASPSKAVG